MSENETTVKIDLGKLAKLLDMPSIASQEVSITDASGQIRKVTVGNVIEKYNDNPDSDNALGLTNKLTLNKVIEALVGMSKPQTLGYTLSALTSGSAQTSFEVDGFNLLPNGTEFKSVITDLYNEVKMGQRGRKAANTEVFKL